jgi:dolichol kinase
LPSKNRLASGLSLQGAAAFAVSGTVASFAWMYGAGTYESSRILLAVVAGGVGAVVELLVSRVDDNLAVPLGTSLAVALAALA